MNFILVPVYLFALIWGACTESVDKSKLHEIAKELIINCKSKVGASDSDIEALKAKKFPETQQGLCLLECVLDQSKIMKNGKFNKSGLIEGFQPIVGDDKIKSENLEKLANTCEKEIGDGDNDKCKTAKLIIECVMQNGKSHGLEMVLD